MASSSRSLESTFDDFLVALDSTSQGRPAAGATPATPVLVGTPATLGSRWTPAAHAAPFSASPSPFAGSLAAAASPPRSTGGRGRSTVAWSLEDGAAARQGYADRRAVSPTAARHSSPSSVWDAPSPKVSRRSLGGVELTFDPIEKLRDLSAVVTQQQSTIDALQTRLEGGLHSLGADLRTAFSEAATLERIIEVEKEMQQWTKRRSEGDAERFLRLDGVAERCQHALVRCGHALLYGAIFSSCVKNDHLPRQARDETTQGSLTKMAFHTARHGTTRSSWRSSAGWTRWSWSCPNRQRSSKTRTRSSKRTRSDCWTGSTPSTRRCRPPRTTSLARQP